MKKLLPLLLIVIVLGSCARKNNNETLIGIQPFENIEPALIDTLQATLYKAYGIRTVVLDPVDMPKTAFTNVRFPRYRADSLLRFLKRNKPDSIDYIMGITKRDISTTKRNKKGKIKDPEWKYKDFGIFGLGYRPGCATVISIYRLQNTSRKNFITRYKKICTHELGHNLALHHCNRHPDCVMQDANESIKTIDNARLWLCDDCKKDIDHLLPKKE